MKKNFTPIHKPLHHHHKKIEENPQTLVLFISGFLLYLFVSFNIFSSQQAVPELYFSFVEENRQAAAEMLYKTQRLDEYPEILQMQTSIHGQSIAEEISRENGARGEQIRQLEGLLVRNPNARDVLFALTLLYKEDGKDKQSQQYLQRVQKIDPQIK